MIYFKIQTRDVNYVNQIMEGYDYLGVVSTVDRTQGLLVLRATPDTTAEARDILARLPIDLEFVDLAAVPVDYHLRYTKLIKA
jgi:hypothetical protein